MKKEIYGVPSLEESEGCLWKNSPDDVNLTEEASFEAANSLWDHLEQKYRLGSAAWDDLLLPGLFLHEKTQIVELVYPPVLGFELINHAREWITKQQANWRVVIPTYLGHRSALVIYANQLRYGCSQAGDIDTSYLKAIILEMLKSREYERVKERAREDGWTLR